MKRTKVFASFLIAIMLCATALVGLAKNTTVMDVHAVDTEPPIKVGVSLPSLTDVHTAKLRTAILSVFPNYNLDAVVCNANYNIETQITQINSFINNGADAIVVMPLDKAALTTVLSDARDAGIPVIVIDRDDGSLPDAMYVDYDYAGKGKKDAEDFIKNYWIEGEDATVLVFAFNYSHGQMYCDGMHDVFKNYPEIDVEYIRVNSPSEAYSQMFARFATDTLPNAIFNCSDENARAVKAAFDDGDYTFILGYPFSNGTIPVYGFINCTHQYEDMAESIADLIQKIMNGEIDYPDYAQHLVDICNC